MSTDRGEIQAMARQFAEAELRPRTSEWDARRELDEDVFGKLAEMGFLGMLIPEEFGGLGFDYATYVTVLEELTHRLAVQRVQRLRPVDRDRGDAVLDLELDVLHGHLSYL